MKASALFFLCHIAFIFLNTPAFNVIAKNKIVRVYCIYWILTFIFKNKIFRQYYFIKWLQCLDRVSNAVFKCLCRRKNKILHLYIYIYFVLSYLISSLLWVLCTIRDYLSIPACTVWIIVSKLSLHLHLHFKMTRSLFHPSLDALWRCLVT